MGSLYKRRGSKKWMMAATVAGRQICKSSHTRNKRLAEKLLARWKQKFWKADSTSQRQSLLSSKTGLPISSRRLLTRIPKSDTNPRGKTQGQLFRDAPERHLSGSY